MALEPEVRHALLTELFWYNSDTLDPIALAKWMRQEYMKWLPEVPICKDCQKPMVQGLYVYKESHYFEEDGSSWTGYKPVPDFEAPGMDCNKIERYRCENCHRVEVASRESDVLTITRTRMGRCGEHAILYTSFLSALGYQARLIATILDGDDHVWTEYRMGDSWVPVDVSAEDPERLIKDRYLFERWGWKLQRVYAIEPGKLPVLVNTYREAKL